MSDLKPRRMGCARKNTRTPPMKRQEEALIEADCLPVFTGDEIDAAIPSFVEGDVIVIVSHAVLGDRKADVSKRLVRLAAVGVLVEVLGHDQGVLYDTDDAVATFAALAMLASTKHTATPRRSKPGRTGKLEDLHPLLWSMVKWLYSRLKKDDLAYLCNNFLGCSGVTRQNIWQAMDAEAKAEMIENKKEGFDPAAIEGKDE